MRPRRLALAVAVTFAVAWLGWSAVARHRRDAALARFRAAGGTTDVADVLGPLVPADRNAATLYQCAVISQNRTYATMGPRRVFEVGTALAPGWLAVADEELAANARSLALIRQARGRPDADWLQPIDLPVADTNYMSMFAIRALGGFDRQRGAGRPPTRG